MSPNQDLSNADLQAAKSICAEFESALCEQTDVSIESVVSSAPQHLQTIIVPELIRVDLAFRGLTGSAPSVESYCKRFPEYEKLIVDTHRALNTNGIVGPDSYDSLEETSFTPSLGRAANPSIEQAAQLSFDHAKQDTPSASDLNRQEALSNTFDLRESRTDSADESPYFFVPNIDKKYIVESELDRGGMGVVLKVQDLHLNRTLAMKVIRGQDDPSASKTEDLTAEKLERFIREASITGRLDHPGVVPVHELGEDGSGRSYFTMKFVQGKTLSNVFQELREGKCNQAHVIEVLIRVCDTIAFAHSKGVIHRDLKPANIMVGEFGETYVMDWGLAKVLREKEQPRNEASAIFPPGLDADSSHTLDGSVMGTPHYMSPEQAAGRIEDLDERSDTYSIGALLYQMLSGHKPFDELKTAFDIVRTVGVKPPVPIREHSRKAPVALVAIANKAMQHEKEDRYSSVAEVADDLRAYLSNRVVTAYRTGLVAKIEKWLVRNRSIVATALLVLIVSLSVIAFLTYRNNLEVTGKNLTLEGQKNILEAQSSQLDLRGKELAESLRLQKEANLKEKEAFNKLWGRKLALDAKNILDEKSDATLASLLALEALERYQYDSVDTHSTIYAGASELSENLILNGDQDRILSAIFSPDGKQVVTISNDGTGIVWDTNTEKQISLFLNKRGASFHSVAFSKDGHQVLASGANGTVGIWDTQSGDRELLVEIGGALDESGVRPRVIDVQYLPDESRLVAATPRGLYLLDSVTGEQIGTFPTNQEADTGRFTNLRLSPDGTRVIVGSDNGHILIWDTDSRQLLSTSDVAEGMTESVRSVDFNFDGSLFVTTSNSSAEEGNSPARIWQTASGELHGEVNPAVGVSAAAFHPHRNLLVLAGNDISDPTVQVWDLESEKVLCTSEKLPATATSIRFAPDSESFVVICSDGNLFVLELESNPSNENTIRRVEQLVGHHQQSTINDARFDSVGGRVVSASNDRSARIWNVYAERPVPKLGRTWFPESSFADNVIKSNSKGNRIVTNTTDRKSFNLWSYPEFKLIKNISLVDPLMTCDFSSDGDLLFLGSNSGDCACWNTQDGSLVRDFKNAGRLYSGSYDPVSERVVLNTHAKTSVWNLANDDESPVFEFLKSKDDFHVLSPDGSVGLSFSSDSLAVKKLDVETGNAKTLPIDTCQAVSFSPDGRYFWCRGPQAMGHQGMNSTSVMILDAKTLTIKHTIEDDPSADMIRWIKWVEFSPDSSKIRVQHYKMVGEQADGPAFSIWSTVDGTKICEFGDYGTDVVWKGATADFSRLLLKTNEGVQLIDGANGRPIATLERSIGKTQKAVFSPDGKFFVTQEVSQTKNPQTGRPTSRVAVWEVETGNLLADLPSKESLFVGDFLPDSSYFTTVSESNQIQAWPINITRETKKHLVRGLSPTEQDFYLAETQVSLSSDQRQSELAALENRIELLGQIITPDRRQEAWRVLDQLKAWLGENPTDEDFDLVIKLSQKLMSGPYNSDPKILLAIADCYRLRGDPVSVVRILEQAARHPRGADVDQAQLETAREAIAPAVASFRSAAWLVEQFQPDDGKQPEAFAEAMSWAKANHVPLHQYLTAQKHFIQMEFESASVLLKPLVDANPTEIEPYLLYANCLLGLSNPQAAAKVLRDALDIEECQDPEIWKTWLQISFRDLGRSPKQVLGDLPPAAKANTTTEATYGDHVRWLLEQLVAGKPLRINSGWYTDVNIGGDDWAADRFYTYGFGFFEFNGEARLFADPIADTEREFVYQSERYFPINAHDLPGGYQVPLPNGQYEITLGFSEIYQEKRSFNVIVEQEPVLTDYDPAQGKFATAEEFKFETTVRDGLLNIEFHSNNASPAKVSAISITQISE